MLHFFIDRCSQDVFNCCDVCSWGTAGRNPGAVSYAYNGFIERVIQKLYIFILYSGILYIQEGNRKLDYR